MSPVRDGSHHRRVIGGRRLRKVKGCRDDRRRVAEAVAEVARLHPVPGFVEEFAEEVHSTAALLLDKCFRGGKLLDLGCGALEKTAVFQVLGYHCSACDDFSDAWHTTGDTVQLLSSFAAQLGIQLHISELGDPLPWAESSFDIVTLLAVIEHLHVSPRDLLNQAGSLLRTGGMVMVTMPNAVNLRKRVSVLMGKSNYPPVASFYGNVGPWRGHVREYTLRETKEIMSWSGFDVVAAGTFHGMTARRLRSRASRWAFRSLCNLWPGLREGIFVVGQKPVGWRPTE